MFEILTGVLAGGARLALDVGHPFESRAPHGVALFVVVIDPEHSIGYEELTRRLDTLIDRLHACGTARGIERIYVPGERSFILAERRERAGLPMPTGRLAHLRRIDSESGLTLTSR